MRATVRTDSWRSSHAISLRSASAGKTACVAVSRVAAQFGTQLYWYQSDVATPLALAAARPAQRPARELVRVEGPGACSSIAVSMDVPMPQVAKSARQRPPRFPITPRVSLLLVILIGGSCWSHADGNPVYSVTGVAVGSRVNVDSNAYKEYRCGASEIFAGLTLCVKRTTSSAMTSPTG